MYKIQLRRCYRVLLFSALGVLLVPALLAQDGSSPTPEVGNARVHVAGPDMVLLDGVSIDGDQYAVYLSATDTGRWQVTSLEPITTRAIPQDVYLDMVTLSADESGELRIDNIYLDGQFYSGTVAFDPAYRSVQTFQFTADEAPNPADHGLLRDLAEAYGVAARPSESSTPPSADDAPQSSRGHQPAEQEWSSEEHAVLQRLDAYAAQGAARLDRLEARIDGVSRRIDAAVAEGALAVGQLMERVTAKARAAGEGVASADDTAPTLSLARARREMATIDPIDLGTGTAVSGRWASTGAGTVTQTDPQARFAKLVIPYRQDSQPRLYRVLTRAIGDGWVGVGMHLGVSEVEAPAGYGHGRSILVWLTRDVRAYGDETTFLEVYISYDDVTMNRVAQSALDSDLGTMSALEILMDPGAGMLTVAVDGVEQFRYRATLAQGSGLELALRALGEGEFADLEVRRR
ncbi:MAG: hypothetical protein ACOCYB_00105 [Alkalispirochaeta sp.]